MSNNHLPAHRGRSLYLPVVATLDLVKGPSPSTCGSGTFTHSHKYSRHYPAYAAYFPV